MPSFGFSTDRVRKLSELHLSQRNFFIDQVSSRSVDAVEMVGFGNHQDAGHFEGGRADCDALGIFSKVAGGSVRGTGEENAEIAPVAVKRKQVDHGLVGPACASVACELTHRAECPLNPATNCVCRCAVKDKHPAAETDVVRPWGRPLRMKQFSE